MANIALNKPSGGQLILSPEDGTSTETVTIPSVGVGKVLQVQQARMTSTYSTTSSSFVFPSELQVSITPTSANSKFLVSCNIWMSTNRWTVNAALFRNDVELGDAPPVGSRPVHFLNWMADQTVQNTHGYIHNTTGEFLDSPNTASPITYKIGVSRRADNEGGDAYARINYSVPDRDSNSYDMRKISTITVWEVSA